MNELNYIDTHIHYIVLYSIHLFLGYTPNHMPHIYIYISKKFFFHNVHIGSLYGNVRYGYGMVRYCTVQMVKSTVQYGSVRYFERLYKHYPNFERLLKHYLESERVLKHCAVCACLYMYRHGTHPLYTSIG